MRNASVSRAEGKIRPDYRVLRYEQAKKIAARKGGGKDQLSLILRAKEYHKDYNSVNKFLIGVVAVSDNTTNQATNQMR